MKKSEQPTRVYSMEAFEKEMEAFEKTSFWTYLVRRDRENILRKVRTNLYYPVKRFFRDIKCWFLYRFHPKHRYNLVDTGLPPGYYDKDYLMLHACFHLLKTFVEGELGGIEKLDYWDTVSFKVSGCCSKKELDALRKRDKEIKDLYLWWNKRVNREVGTWKDEVKHNDEDEKMLCRLMKIRLFLWT